MPTAIANGTSVRITSSSARRSVSPGKADQLMLATHQAATSQISQLRRSSISERRQRRRTTTSARPAMASE